MKVRKRRRLSRRARRIRFYVFLALLGATIIFYSGHGPFGQLMAEPLPDKALADVTSSSPTSAPRNTAEVAAQAEELQVEVAATWREREAILADLQAIADLVPPVYRLPVVRAAREFGLEPRLVAAQASVENEAWDPYAIGSQGQVGLLQVLPQTQEEVIDLGLVEPCDLTDPQCNLRVGAAYLALCISRTGGVETGLRYYNGGPGWPQLPATAEYAAKVLSKAQGEPEVVGLPEGATKW